MGAIGVDWKAKKLDVGILNSKQAYTLKQLLVELSERYQDKFWEYFSKDLKPKRGTIILLNDADYKIAEGLETVLKPNDQLVFVPTISGGCF